MGDSLTQNIEIEKRDLKRCFIITPIGNANSETRRMADGVIGSALRPILEQRGFKVITPHQMSNPGAIDRVVIQQILECELVIANLTGLNPNVMYELAVRHSFGKPVVCIAESLTNLPFDIHSQRVLFYTNDMRGVEELQSALPEYIDSAMIESPLNPIVNTKTDLSVSDNATDAQKAILSKLNVLLDSMAIKTPEPKNTYRKVRANGMQTFYVCSESDAVAYRLYERGYSLIVRDNKFLNGLPE